MQITRNNSNDEAYEIMFDDLIKDVFGVSFAPWFARKLWDARYESHSVIENGRMLANACIYKTQMKVRGNPFYALQLGAVATREEVRGNGLSRLLMEHILARYPDTPAFLGANPSVAEFYPRFGFRPVQTYCPQIKAAIDNDTAGAVRLNPDDAAVIKAVQSRKMYSNAMDSLNTQPIQMFHLLLDYPDAIYHLPGCGAMVVAEQNGETLWIADVIAQAPVSLDALFKELPFRAVQRVEFGFCPDWLGVAPEWSAMDARKEPYFIRGAWDLPERFRFPMLSET